MNELATATAHGWDPTVVMWAIGGLVVALTVLLGIIRRHDLKQVEDLKASHDKQVAEVKASVEWMEVHHVRKETLDRVERTFRDAVDEMKTERREMHRENQAGIKEIKESVTGIHRRIDEEFRVRNQK